MQSDMASLAFLQSNAIADLLNNTEWGFAVAECFHIVFFAVAIGTIMIVDLRLLGARVSTHNFCQTTARHLGVYVDRAHGDGACGDGAVFV
jgi:hypothetical protein